MENKIEFSKKYLPTGKHKDNLMLSLKKNIKLKNNKKRKKLNLSLAIDVSYSMSSGINNKSNYFSLRQLNNIETEILDSKLKQVKDAVIQSLNYMSDGDFISIITFSDEADVILPQTEFKTENKDSIIKKINDLSVTGSTNLHGGWFKSAKEVTKKFNDDYLNRIILLTDGQSNRGELDKEIILSDIKSLCKTGISTTCFGVGYDFNEDLLLDISRVGEGNFYYIDSDGEKVKEMFSIEFNGLSSIIGTNVSLEFKLNKNIKIIQNMNDLREISKNKYLIPNIINNKDVSYLFKIKTNFKNNITNKNLGKIILKYQDIDGNINKVKIKINTNIISSNEWNKEEINKELHINKTLLQVAKNKEKAAKKLKNGDIENAKLILSSSKNKILNSGYEDIRLNNEIDEITNSLNVSDSGILRKAMVYQSYISKK